MIAVIGGIQKGECGDVTGVGKYSKVKLVGEGNIFPLLKYQKYHTKAVSTKHWFVLVSCRHISIYRKAIFVGYAKAMLPKPIFSLVNSVVKIPMAWRYRRLGSKLTSSSEYQTMFLSKLVDDNKSCEYAKHYDFPSISSVADYQRRVPLIEYTDIQENVESMLGGKENVLTSNHVTWFAQTAGTTGSASKYIPVTNQALKDNHIQGPRDFLSYYLTANPDSGVFAGYSVILSGPRSANPITQEQNVGFISRILDHHRPSWTNYFTALGQEYHACADRNQKMDYVVRHAGPQDVRVIAGVGPWIVMLGQKLQQYYEKPISEIRPNLELILSGGVSMDIYKPQYRNIFGTDVRIYNIYNASEGFYGFQNTNDDHSIMLATHHAIFYEFIPMSEYRGRNSEKVVTLENVVVGENYALVVTTAAGLRRYSTGDTLRCVSTAPHKFVITGRTKYYLNIFDEKTSIDIVTAALAYACKKHACITKEYSVGPKFFANSTGCHEWIIEFERAPQDIEGFRDDLDRVLQELNNHYKGKRSQDVLLQAPIVHVAPAGLFYKRLASKGRLGGQSKIPNLRNDRTYLDELLALMKT